MQPSTATGPSHRPPPVSTCPRCNGPHVLALRSVTVKRAFNWRECGECGYLWVLSCNWELPGMAARTPSGEKAGA